MGEHVREVDVRVGMRPGHPRGKPRQPVFFGGTRWFSSTPGDALREARNGLSEGPPETIYYMVESG